MSFPRGNERRGASSRLPKNWRGEIDGAILVPGGFFYFSGPAMAHGIEKNWEVSVQPWFRLLYRAESLAFNYNLSGSRSSGSVLTSVQGSGSGTFRIRENQQRIRDAADLQQWTLGLEAEVTVTDTTTSESFFYQAEGELGVVHQPPGGGFHPMSLLASGVFECRFPVFGGLPAMGVVFSSLPGPGLKPCQIDLLGRPLLFYCTEWVNFSGAVNFDQDMEF